MKQQQKPTLYGFHAVRAAWLNPRRHVQSLWITQEALKGFEETLQEGARRNLKRPKPTIVDKRQMEKMLPQGAVHQGVALVVDNLPEMDVQDLIIQAAGDALILILDQVTDPHNVGAIIRSASAFGAAGLIMQKKHAPELTGVLAKTACGGVDHLPVALATNLSRAIEELQENGFFVAGLDERGDPLSSYKAGGRQALVLGSEGEGIRRLVKEHCDVLLRLPTQGEIQSLNVSNAAAVALYALRS
ncbi:MAG: 23S rRNA (guanosine(2251)-2'-O)-methyltransferase RlmB [Alphaproteobacteria bacterium]|nr:23S rRNA (guanosine(2251)-2'-O)-methyltransferase RlmB [Alphaproteobacteria bacterium]